MTHDQLQQLSDAATPGPWETEEDPTQDGGHETLAVIPHRSGGFGTWVLCAFHNWKEASAGERRISWKEATANIQLSVALRNAVPEIIAALRERDEAADTIEALQRQLAEAKAALLDTAASLAASISLLEKGGKAAKKAAPSDRMFDQMVVDYTASLDRARAALAKMEKKDG